MAKKLFIYFIILLIGTSLKANFNPDSLKKVSITQKDSALVDTYFSLFKYYFKKNRQPDSMYRYAQRSYSSSEKYKLYSRLVKSKRAIVLSLMELQKVELAKEQLNEGIELAKKYKNVNEVIEMNNLFGFIYGKENELDKSAFYYLNSAKEYEKLKDYPNLAFTYKNVVVIFTLLDQFPKILYYTTKSLELLPKINEKENPEIIVGVYSSAAQHFFYVGEKNNKLSLMDSALIFADSCLKIAGRYNIKQGLADAYYIIGNHFIKKREFTRAENYFIKALENKNNIQERNAFNIYTGLVNININTQNYNKAKLFIDTCKSLPISNELDGPLIISELEYYLYKAMGDNTKALIAHEIFLKETKAILENTRNKTINDLETKYQTELKEEKIAKLNQQQEINKLQIRSLIGFGGAAILAIITIVFFYRQSAIKNKLKTIETEQRLNRARMDPHFFFNILSSLRSFTLKENNAIKTADYLTKYSKIMRQSLESSYNELISLETELEFLNSYFEIQKLRYPSKFNYEINIAENIETSEIQLPSMIVQPFVENAIEHGFSENTEMGKILLGFSVDNEELKITISDNGSGTTNNSAPQKSYPSRATQIVKDRLFLLNKQYKSNARFDISSQQSSGFTVVLVLPLIYSK
ncbi:MAG: histidine kinase [Bacteroidota bacterium]|nr:histidine kinase [Bacteroidota bacterium]